MTTVPCRFTWLVCNFYQSTIVPVCASESPGPFAKYSWVGRKPGAVLSEDGEGVMTVGGGNRDRSESHFLKIL